MSTHALLEIIEKTCRIDSRTVEGSDGTVLVGEIYAQCLAQMGFEVTWYKPLPEEGKRGQHLMAVRNASSKIKLILIGAPTIDGLGILVGHLHNTDEWADTQTLSARKSLAADLIIDCCRSSARG